MTEICHPVPVLHSHTGRTWILTERRCFSLMKKLFTILILLAITLSVVVAFAASSKPAPVDLIITTSDGEELSLTELLEQNDLVILNIFQPGQASSSLELPLFDDICEDLDNRVAIVAVTPAVSPDLAFSKSTLGLSFPIGTASELAPYLRGKGVEIQAYPTTVVLNSEGSVIYTQSGYFRLPSQIRSVVNYLLSSPGTAATSYTLVVRDRQNQPVPGVVLNFYGNSTSQMLTSDADGVVIFTARQGDYKFQVLSVPEGYELDRGFEGTVQEWTTVTV